MTYTAHPDFRPELFDDPREYEEVPLRDCKGPFPNLYRDDTRAEFIRDVIAMANTARLFGKPAYIFFGIDRNGNFQDITPDLQVYEQRAGSPHDAWEGVQRQIAHLVQEYITPLFAGCELKWGYYEIPDREEAYLLAYILFQPLTPPRPYTVRKAIKNELSAGQCWIRMGESKAEVKREEISPDDARHCYAYAEVPYVLPSLWQAYLGGLWADREANLPQAQGIVAYQELFAADGRLLQDAVEEFLASNKTLLILSGTAGCGKSAFLQRLVGKWANDEAAAIAEICKREEFRPPPEWIPVYLSLRGRRIAATWSLADDVLNKVNQLSRSAFWKKRPAHPEQLLEYTELHWLLCLDGLDEIWSEPGRGHFMEGLQTFLEEYPRVKVMLTTRPDIISRGLLETRDEVIDIAPLKPEQILRYIQNFPGAEDAERYGGIEAFLRSDAELWELCQAPAYLEAAVTAFVDAYPQPLEEPATLPVELPEPVLENLGEPTVSTEVAEAPVVGTTGLVLEEPIITQVNESAEERTLEREDVVLPISMGVLLERVYNHLWEREQGRHSDKPEQWVMWRERTECLALKMDGVRESFSLNKTCGLVGGKKAISRLLSLGVLRQDTPETWLRFATHLTQLYFAAAFLKPYLSQAACHHEARQHIKHTSPDFRQRLLEILSHISNVNPYPIFQEVNNESV